MKIAQYLLFLLASAGLITTPAEAAPRIVPVSTSDGLQNALAAVEDGDVIQLADGTYSVAALTGFYDFFFIVDPGVHFSVQAVNSGAAILDGAGSERILEYRVDTQGFEGWVTFEGLVFSNGKTTTFDAGAIMVRGGRSTFIDCVFQDNQGLPATTSGASAGALQVGTQSVIQVSRCTFSGNTSDNHGAGIIVGQGSTAYIHDTVFSSNRSNLSGHRHNSLGGAIHIYNGLPGTTSSLYISNSRFFNNQAGFAGGGIMAKGNFSSQSQPVASPTIVVIANSTFEDNTALNHASVSPLSPTEGGGIMAENNVSLSVYNSRFVNNSGGLGGAISSYRGAIDVESSIFRNNTAFGRTDTNSTGRGGAIKSHANDNCSDDTNFRTGSLSVTDSFFEGNQAQGGGAIFVAGDTTRMFTSTPGCQMGTLATNRLPVVLDRITIANCSVDDIIGNHAIGGGVYGLLVDFTLTDSMILDSTASGTDPSDFGSSSQGHGGGASFRKLSTLEITGTTFSGNVADHEGGGLHIHGSEVQTFNNNAFIGNEVSPGGARPETSSEGAAIFVSPSLPDSFDATGAIKNSIFTDNIGLPIFDADAADSHACDCLNLVTYDNNTFYNNTYGDSVYRDNQVSGTHSAQELNTLVVDHGGGTLTKKSLNEYNLDEVSPIITSALLATPQGLINATAAGDGVGSTESFLAWSWNGGCAEIDKIELNGSDNMGFTSSNQGQHLLEVWDGGVCSGTADHSIVEDVLLVASPSADLSADPIAILGGEQSTLSWNQTGGTLVNGMISNDAASTLVASSGSVVVAPIASTGYHFSIVTRRGGATADETVYVDEEPPTSIFSDEFETGDTISWTSVSGL